MTKHIIVDFYRLSIHKGGSIGFEDVAQQVSTLNIEDRVVEINNCPVWLYEFCREDRYLVGDIIKLRMQNLPSRGSRTGSIKDFDFLDDEGVSEHVAFFYHIDTQVLLLQRIQGGVDMGNFANYFEQLYSLQLDNVQTSSSISIIDKDILDIDAIKQLDRVKEVHHYEIKVARPDNLDEFIEVDDTVQELFRINEKLNSLTIGAEFSIGNNKNTSISLKDVIKITKSLLRINNHDPGKVKKITARALEEGAKNSRSFNFLSNIVKEVVDINVSTRSKVLPYSARVEGLKEAWGRRQQQLNDMFLSLKH